jgi:sugar lactone lactonase YvrE/predicted glycoside hydrolase/deacetylase ChbG (UPF0249 family)
MSLYLLALLAGLFLPGPAGGLPPERAVAPVKVVEVPGYTEGVVFDAAGDAFVSDTWNGTVYRVGADGAATVWAKTGAPNGHRILADGTHLVCDGSQHAVLRLDAAGAVIGKASSECDGRPLRAPNDLALDPAGGFYFTDPGGSDEKNPIGTVHHVDAAGRTSLVAEGLAFPNGIVLRPDGKTLLVGESGHNRILEYPVLSPGKVGERRVFAALPEKRGKQIGNSPDGMCLDEAGNLYVAHWGMGQVQVLGPDGKLLRTYAAGNLTASNVAFGGPNMDRLYVTGAIEGERTSPGALWRLDLTGVRGLRVLPKSLAERLGYAADAKLLIVNADDLGMAHSIDAASIRGLEGGLVSSASVMVPCPWFPEAAAYARSRPDADLGLHLTLTSEWKQYRWGPVLPAERVRSLLAPDGYLYPTEDQAAAHIDPGEAEAEIRAQVERARAFGMRPTHLDSHMGTLYQNRPLFEALLRVARENRLPVRMSKEWFAQMDYLAAIVRPDEVMLDRIVTIGPEEPPERWAAFYTNAVKGLRPGVTEMVVHLAFDDEEMRAVAADHPDWGSAWRQRDFDFFTSAEFRRLLDENNVKLVTWRELGKLVAGP